MAQGRGTAAVAEGDILEFNVTVDLFHLGVFAGLVLLGLVIHDLGQTLDGDLCLLDGHLQADQLADRVRKVRGKGAEGHIAAQRHLTVQHLHDAHIRGDHAEDGGDEGGDQGLHRADLAGAQADLQALDVFPLQSFQLTVLFGVALDGLDAPEALDHLAVEDSRLLHGLFVDPLEGLLEDEHQQDAQQGGEDRNGEEGGIHPEEDDAGGAGHHNIHHDAQRDAGEHRFDGAGVGVAGGDLAGLAGGEELHGQFENMPEVAQHQGDIDLDGQIDEHPLPHHTDECAGDAHDAEHQNNGHQQALQPVGKDLIHQYLVVHRGCDPDDGQDDRAEDGVEEELLLGPQQVEETLDHAALLLLACLELRGGGHQEQNAGKVLVELIEGDLFQLFCRVADDDVVAASELLSFVSALLPLLFLPDHVPTPLAVVLDGGLLKDRHKVGQTLVGDDLCNTGSGEFAEEVFPVYPDGGGAESQLLRRLFHTGQVCAF